MQLKHRKPHSFCSLNYRQKGGTYAPLEIKKSNKFREYSIER